jgi:hypothetical protein
VKIQRQNNPDRGLETLDDLRDFIKKTPIDLLLCSGIRILKHDIHSKNIKGI